MARQEQERPREERLQLLVDEYKKEHSGHEPSKAILALFNIRLNLEDRTRLNWRNNLQHHNAYKLIWENHDKPEVLRRLFTHQYVAAADSLSYVVMRFAAFDLVNQLVGVVGSSGSQEIELDTHLANAEAFFRGRSTDLIKLTNAFSVNNHQLKISEALEGGLLAGVSLVLDELSLDEAPMVTHPWDHRNETLTLGTSFANIYGKDFVPSSIPGLSILARQNEHARPALTARFVPLVA
ncbi:MAG: hypothetical protein ACREGI_03960 [Candidatus Levyibacteriota bacterium]